MNQREEGGQGPTTIVLMPAGRRGFKMPGTVALTAGCGHQALFAPSTIVFLTSAEGAGSPTICADCFAKEDLTEDARVGALPGTETELVSAFGVAVTEQIMAVARDREFLIKASKPPTR
jgi:hypothetical protein